VHHAAWQLLDAHETTVARASLVIDGPGGIGEKVMGGAAPTSTLLFLDDPCAIAADRAGMLTSLTPATTGWWRSRQTAWSR
jgi:hypothetical protein